MPHRSIASAQSHADYSGVAVVNIISGISRALPAVFDIYEGARDALRRYGQASPPAAPAIAPAPPPVVTVAERVTVAVPAASPVVQPAPYPKPVWGPVG